MVFNFHRGVGSPFANEQKTAVASVQIRWVHIAKCGQSFATTIYAWGCEPAIAKHAIDFLVTSKSPSKVTQAAHRWKAENCSVPHRHVIPPVESHFPVDYKRDAGHVVTMFRSPKQRNLSDKAYFHRTQTELGHQTYMMTGTKRPTLVDAKAAARMVSGRELLFAGILERWNESIVLFHCMFMPETKPLQAQLENLHPGTSSNEQGANVNKSDIPDDPADELLYISALHRFDRDVTAHRSCVNEKAAEWQILL